MRLVTFNKEGHDSFIDFIKAYAILCVLFGHTFLWVDKVAYSVWAGMQVPLFILIQTFHGYKKEQVKLRFGKVLRRVLLPFLIFEILTFCVAFFCFRTDCNLLIDNVITGGGMVLGLIILGFTYKSLCCFQFFRLLLNDLIR